MEDPMTRKYPIVSPDLTVKALRDSGYKSTAHAIAELIDNSIEAEADLIELFVVEARTRVSERARHRVETIAVLDNGSGMDKETLRHSLRFGAGTRQERKGIGRFGVGLPNSSMSQCERVDVWSWQNGPDNAQHTYLDLDEIRKGHQEVPEPQHEPLPAQWQNLAEGLGRSGTLVQWTRLDRVQWRGAEATLRNAGELVGRIYRRFIADGRVRIRLVPVRDGEELPGAQDAAPNDPLYLMAPSSTPTPFDTKPMFRPYGGGNVGEIGIEKFMVQDIHGNEHPVYVRSSIARDAARRPDIDGEPWPEGISPTINPGITPWGKHAFRNQGISLVRADRELDLDTGWVNSYDTRERWWGIEIDFPPALDEVFGVTNNKQAATIFSSLAHFQWKEEAAGLSKEGLTWDEYRERLREEADPRLPLIEIVYHIREKLLKHIRDDLEAQTLGTRSSRKRHEDAEIKAEEAVKRRRTETKPSFTDQLAKQATEEERKQQQVESLVKVHRYSEADAERIVAETISQDRHVRLLTSRNPESPAFFNVEYMPGMLQVALNIDHPVYNDLIAVLEEGIESASREELIDRIRRAANAFKLLLFSWARFEDEQPEKPRERAKKMRQDWGRVAGEFFNADDEDDE